MQGEDVLEEYPKTAIEILDKVEADSYGCLNQFIDSIQVPLYSFSSLLAQQRVG